MKILSLAGLLVLSCICFAQELVIDDFPYTTNSAAQAAWTNGYQTPPVYVTSQGPYGQGVTTVFACPFSSGQARCYWDKAQTLDVSGYDLFALSLYCPDITAVGYFTLYFQSGGGWYACGSVLENQGWNYLVFAKADFVAEGSPAGWHLIDGVRLSPWNGADQDVLLYADSLRALNSRVVIVYGSYTLQHAPGEQELVDKLVDLFCWLLARFDITYQVVTDEELCLGLHTDAALVILPYNTHVYDQEVTVLDQFLQDGGKMYIFYGPDNRLLDLAGLAYLAWVPDDMGFIDFSQSTIIGLPQQMGQQSWNYIRVDPGPGNQVQGTWCDPQGGASGDPAVVTGPFGMYMSHILLEDDLNAKEQFLAAVTGHMAPDLYETIARASLRRLEQTGRYSNFASAVSGMHGKGYNTVNRTDLVAGLDQAQSLYDAGHGFYQNQDYAQVIAPAFAARTWLNSAYALAQSPARDEWRGFWFETTDIGNFSQGWLQVASELTDCGITQVLPNMLTAGTAHYPSAYIPTSSTCQTYGDQMAQASTAAAGQNLGLHVWIITFNLWGAPQSFIQQLRSAGRTQKDVYGNDIDWLCPSHSDNIQLELDLVQEILTLYPVHGIHLDYIRYPDSAGCYCQTCRQAFENYHGGSVANWPWDCYSGNLAAEYRAFRRSRITAVVAQIHALMQAQHPGKQLSAAVFANIDWASDAIGQDWLYWAQQGYLDFVCPMNYTSDYLEFAAFTSDQLARVPAGLPLYPGIYVFEPLDSVIAQVLTCRDLSAPGFTCFCFNPATRDAIAVPFAQGLCRAIGFGDFSLNGATDSQDLGMLLACQGHTTGYLDLDRDGQVNFPDVTLLVLSW